MKLNDYIRGRRKGREAHRIELDALGDPFLRDALEGYDMVEGDHTEALGRLSERISMRTRQGRRHGRRPVPVWRRASVWGSAAALVMCVALSGLILNMLQNDMFDKALAIHDLTVPLPELMRIEDDIPLLPEPLRATAAPVPPVVVPVVVPDMLIVERAETIPFEPDDFDAYFEDRSNVSYTESVSMREIGEIGESPQPVRERVLVGRVVDEDGRPVTGATVASDNSKMAVTGPEGEFEIEVTGEQPGIYASSIGYEAKAVDALQGSSSPVVIALERSADWQYEVLVQPDARRKRRTGTAIPPAGADSSLDRSELGSGSVSGITGGSMAAAPEIWKPAGAVTGMVPVMSAPAAPVPLSVGRGSYDVVTRAIASGTIPAAAAVRTEELVNRFTYDRPLPSGRDALRISCESGPCPWNTANRLIIITVRTKVGGNSEEVAAADVTATVHFEPLAVTSYRLVGYEKVLEAETAGVDMYAGQEITVLYEVVSVPGMEGRLITVRAEYGRPGSRRRAAVTAEARDSGVEPSADFHFASAVALFGELLQGSPYTVHAGFEDVVAAAHRGVRSGSDHARMEFVGFAETVRELVR